MTPSIPFRAAVRGRRARSGDARTRSHAVRRAGRRPVRRKRSIGRARSEEPIQPGEPLLFVLKKESAGHDRPRAEARSGGAVWTLSSLILLFERLYRQDLYFHRCSLIKQDAFNAHFGFERHRRRIDRIQQKKPISACHQKPLAATLLNLPARTDLKLNDAYF